MGLPAGETNQRGKPDAYRGQNAFTLPEVMVMLLVVGILILSGTAGIVLMSKSSLRTSDYTQAMARVEAKMIEMMATTYNPPNYPFCSTNVSFSTNDSISLDQSGTNYRVSGTVVTLTQPVAQGHLVTVTGTFLEPSQTNVPLVVTLQTVVNAFSGGQGSHQ